MPPEPQPRFFALIKSSDNEKPITFVMMTRLDDHKGEKPTYGIQAWSTLQEGLDYFERGYNNGHRRSAEGATSAALHWMFFHPSIIEVPAEYVEPEQINAWLLSLCEGEPTLTSFSNIAGHMYGVIYNAAGAALWEAGVKPALISEKTFRTPESS